MPYTQDGRLIAIDTSLRKDVLLLVNFTCQEAISRLFNIHASVVSLKQDIDPASLLGQPATISVILKDDKKRYFNGIISRFAAVGSDGTLGQYELEIVPSLWTLTRMADCRIFHNLTPPAIIQSVLSAKGITKVTVNCPASYPTLEYTVQYRETSFNFISRLMEEYGIFYFFKHTENEHELMIIDATAAFEECADQKTASYNLATGGLDADDVINSWGLTKELRSGKMTQSDYNFKTPAYDLSNTSATVIQNLPNSSLEVFDYPGRYTQTADGKALTDVRMEEEETNFSTVHGTSTCRGFNTGFWFSLTGFTVSSMEGEYILTEIQHTASVGGTYREEGMEGADTYANQFTCVPQSVRYRSPRVTPKPFVQGPQTAVVVGQNASSGAGVSENAGGDGEEIWVDNFGRVVVQFFWDKVRADHKSCRVRVSQDWAGQGWGMINIPRVGQEVIVSFLEGDPDRPIITGRVYNAEQTVPYTLPEFGTRTTFKTRSTPKASADNYNELRFEDKKDSEQVFIHAEREMDTRVKADAREWIGHDRSLMVINNQRKQVGGNVSAEIGENLYEKVAGDVHMEVVGKQLEKVAGDLHVTIGGKQFEDIGADLNQNVAQNINQKAGETISIQAGQNLYEKSGMNYAHEAGTMIHLKGGEMVVIEAGAELSLKVGGNFITIDAAGVSIQGTMVMINSGGAAGSGCGSSPTSPDAPTKPDKPNDPDQADDGSKGTKMN
jgi:type VI secretion system secreted protein VgrG